MLLMSGLASNAAAQDGLKNTSPNKAHKVRTYLENIGVNNPRIIALTTSVSARMEGENLRLGQYQMESGRVVLHYAAQPKVSIRQLTLKFQPAHTPNTELQATTRSVRLQYRYQF